MTWGRRTYSTPEAEIRDLRAHLVADSITREKQMVRLLKLVRSEERAKTLSKLSGLKNRVES